MPESAKRSTPIRIATLLQFFNEVDGYYEMVNDELASTLLRWELLEDSNRSSAGRPWSFLKWSLTVSFLEMMNALQWFASGILLQRLAYLPAQVQQQYYYSIFFSYGSFLAIHGKGHYTVSIEETESDETRAIRRELWLDEGPPPHIAIKKKGRGGEHEIRAKWFYEVFKGWDLKDSHPAVLMFEQDRTHHTRFRNMFTYSLAGIAEELYHRDTSAPITDELLIRLWHGDAELVDYFPEEFWVLEHLRASLDMHTRFIEDFGDGAPYTRVQSHIINSLVSHHENTGFAPVVEEILQPFLARL